MKFREIIVVVCGLMAQTIFTSQTPETRAFSDKGQALSSLVAVTFGDSNLYGAKKKWDDASIAQWQSFINVTMPNYIKSLQPNDELLNAIMAEIQRKNRDLIYCIKIIKADYNLVSSAQNVLQDIQSKMQRIQKDLGNAIQRTSAINQQYRQKMLNALAIAIEQTAKKAIDDAIKVKVRRDLEEDWTDIG